MSIPATRTVVYLASIPHGLPVPEDYRVVQEEFHAEADKLVLKTLFVSVDPYLRVLMKGGDKVGYLPPFQVGSPVQSILVAKVVHVPEAARDKYQVGDVVAGGHLDWSDFNTLDVASPLIHKLPAGTPPKAALSLYGTTGLTAYHGLLDVGQLESYPAGSTVFVSGAAGATGNVVGQIAKLKGYYVVGSAGSDDKVEWLKTHAGFDAAFNYKKSSDLRQSLREIAPKGIDVYFDNVGGETFDAVLDVINHKGVVINCGAISGYNASSPLLGPRVESALIFKELRLQGFLVSSFRNKWDHSIPELAGWQAAGKITDFTTVFPQTGVDAIHLAFIDMLKGENVGKMIVQVADE